MNVPRHMSHRARVRTALNHQQPDRLPIDFGGTCLSSAKPEMQSAIVDLLGLQGEADPRFPRFDDRIQRYFDTDLRSITPKEGRKWGFGRTTDAPMRNLAIDDLKTWPWPEPNDAMVEGLRDEAKFLHNETDYAICAGQIGQGIFELACWLRGYDQILLDMAIDDAFVHAFNQKVLETNIRLGDLYFGEIGEYVDLVIIGDDLAMQNSPFMSLEMFRKLVKPYFKEYIASIRKLCPYAFIIHHSCGSTITFLDDLAEIGVDIVNPVQTNAVGMEPEALATKKDKLCFHGGGDLQYILPHGTTEEVEEFAKHLITHLAKDGGYIFAPCHTLPADVKPENVITIFEACRKWGKAKTYIGG